MQTPLILTVDIGTTSTRAMLFDGAARPIPGAVAQVANQLRTTHDGGAEFDADQLFEAVVDAIDQLLDRSNLDNQRIAAVAMDTFVGNVLGVNHAFEPQTPVFTYADTRNAADARALRDELGTDGLAASHDRTGCMLHTSYLPARFRWLQRTRPEVMSRVSHWISIGEYVMRRLTDQSWVSYSVASWSGLLNRRTLSWDVDWLAELSVPSNTLAILKDVDEAAQGLASTWAARWPALAESAVFPAIGDGAAANIGSGCDNAERIALTIGTTAAMRMVVDHAIGAECHPAVETVPSGLWLYRVSASRGLLGGATTEGGSLFAWLVQNLQLPPADLLETELSNRPPATHGLTVLPFIGGERAPGWNEAARGLYGGISMHTTAVDMVQASLESMAYRFKLIHDRIKAHLPSDAHQTIIASGGAVLHSPAWLQIIADVLNEPVVALEESELTSRGIALLALEALEVIKQPSDLPPSTGEVFQPDLGHHAAHADALDAHVEMYDRLYVR